MFCWLFFLQPLIKTRDAASWPQTEALIVDSEIVEHVGDESSSWSAKFSYTYTVNGKEYQNDRYSFLKLSGSRRAAKKLQRKHPVGSRTPCFYNPSAPSHSVLNRSLNSSVLLGLIPLAFSLVGGIVLYGVLFRQWGSDTGKSGSVGHLPVGTTSRSALKSEAGNSDQLPDDLLDQQFDGPLKLKPAMSKWAVLSMGLLFGIFWNGIVSFFVLHVIDEGFPIFLTLFMIPFVLVGLAITFSCIYVFLSLFNPRIEVALSNGAVPLGDEVDVAWEVIGKSGRIRKLEILIEGEESATYQRGSEHAYR